MKKMYMSVTPVGTEAALIANMRRVGGIAHLAQKNLAEEVAAPRCIGAILVASVTV